MKIRMKITVVFAAAFIICGFLVAGGLTFVLDSLSSKMLKKQAGNITMFLKQRIIYESAIAVPKEFSEEVLSDFAIAMRVAEESRGFEIKKYCL